MSGQMSSRDACLSVNNVVKSYGSELALDDVSLQVNRGEFVAILGPNGAGKSTLFQLLSGLFLPDSGSVHIDGQDLQTSTITALAKLGIVFQQITLDLDLSVNRNLKFHCDLYGIDGASAKIAEGIHRFELQAAANKRCRTLSGGNRRKVELIRSLLHSPSILLMDEATVGLDPASRDTLLKEVNGLCKEQGLAVLWATHLVDEAVNADRVVILHKGRVIQQGTAQSIMESTGKPDLLSAFLGLTEKTEGGKVGDE